MSDPLFAPRQWAKRREEAMTEKKVVQAVTDYLSIFAAEIGEYSGDGSDLEWGQMIGADMVIGYNRNPGRTVAYMMRPDGTTYDLEFEHEHAEEKLPFSDEREITS